MEQEGIYEDGSEWILARQVSGSRYAIDLPLRVFGLEEPRNTQLRHPMRWFGLVFFGGLSDVPATMWSPDSRYIAYQLDGKLRKIDVAGGPLESAF